MLPRFLQFSRMKTPAQLYHWIFKGYDNMSVECRKRSGKTRYLHLSVLF